MAERTDLVTEVWRLLSELASLFRRAAEVQTPVDLHFDTMTVWMVALSTGAVVTLGPALSIDRKSVV